MLLARSKAYEVERNGLESWNNPSVQKRLADIADERLAALRTRYENPYWRSAAMQLEDRTLSVLRDFGHELRSRPLVGTQAGGQVNALTMQAPSQIGGHLILIEEQLFLFAHLFSKAIARALPVEDASGPRYSLDPREVKKRIDADARISIRFYDVLSAYALTGEPENAKPYLAEPIYDFLASHFCVSMEYFVLAHEYGHIVAGHLDDAHQIQSIGAGPRELEFRWAQEYKADYFGIQIAVAALLRLEDTFDFPRAFVGSDIFFGCMDVMDRATSLLKAGEERMFQIGSHPPAQRRRAYLRSQLPKILGTENRHAIEATLELSQAVSWVIEELWRAAREYLRLDWRFSNGIWPGWQVLRDGGDT